MKVRMGMNGCVIPGTPICIDYWTRLPNKKCLRFLSHLHSDHTYGLSSTFCEKIYTSPFNAWLLHRWFKVLPQLVVPLTLGDSHVLEDPTTEKVFSVTLFEANHCPGSIMFLFQGEFGNILYTGDFRYRPGILEHPMLKSIIETESLHQLYMDNTFAAEHCEFPPRHKALSQLLELIRQHPEHNILLGIRKLGKEEVLQTVALELNELVHVGEDKLAILRHLQYQQVFTSDPLQARIYAKEIHLINSAYIHALQMEKGPVLTVLLSALPFVVPSTRLTLPDGVHYIPYSDHSCYSELVEFVSKVKPHSIHPIVKQPKFNVGVTRRSDFSNSDFLNNVWHNSVIPQSILKLCKNDTDVKAISSGKSVTGSDLFKGVSKRACKLRKAVDNESSSNNENHVDSQSKNKSNIEPSEKLINFSDEETSPVSDEESEVSGNCYSSVISTPSLEDQNECKNITDCGSKMCNIQARDTSLKKEPQEIIKSICSGTNMSLNEVDMSSSLLDTISTVSSPSNSRNSTPISMFSTSLEVNTTNNLSAPTDKLYATGVKEAIIILSRYGEEDRKNCLMSNTSGKNRLSEKFSDIVVNMENYEYNSFYNDITATEPNQARTQQTPINNTISISSSSKLPFINGEVYSSHINEEEMSINTAHTNNLKVGYSESFFLHIDTVYNSWQETCLSPIQDHYICNCNNLFTWQGTDWKTVFKQIDSAKKS